MNLLKSINRKIGLVLFIVASSYLLVSYQIPSYPYVPVDADLVPKSLGYLLAVLSIILFFSRKIETEEEKKKRTLPKKEIFMLFAVFTMIIIYIALMEIIGFLIMTVLFIFFCSWFLGYKNVKVNILVSILFPLSIYYLFTYVLLISLPQGMLPI